MRLRKQRTLAPAERIEIWVAEGVYRPHLGGETPRERSLYTFEMINNVSVYGGFEGNEIDLMRARLASQIPPY